MILPDVTVTKACAPACGWAPPDVETELGAVAGVEAGVDAGADAGAEDGAEDGAEAGAALLRFRTVTWTGCALAPPIYLKKKKNSHNISVRNTNSSPYIKQQFPLYGNRM